MHIDASAAMTGITRFCELGKPWTYSKVKDPDFIPPIVREGIFQCSVFLYAHCFSEVWIVLHFVTGRGDKQ